MSRQGDSHKGQEDDWWRQLYDEEAGEGPPPTAGRDSIDEHFDSALTAMNRPPAPPAADTLRLRRPTPPPPPPSWPRPTRTPTPRAEAEPEERSPEPQATEEQAAGPAARGSEPPPWDAWAARPMFPSGDEPDEPPASGGWAAPPSAAEPWAPSPRVPDRPPHPAPAPADATPAPAEPWSPRLPPDEPGTPPAATEPPADGGPESPTRPTPARPWPPLGRTPQVPEPEDTAADVPPAPTRVEAERNPSPGASTPEPSADLSEDAAEPAPYAPSGAWPPIGRAPEGDAPEGDTSEPSPEPSPYAAPGPWPPVGRAPGTDTSEPTSGAGANPYGATAGYGQVAGGGGESQSAGETAFGEGGVRWAPELPPGWVPADGEDGEPAAAVVGGGPPTYAAEPTAWPEADPDRLDGLVPDTVLDGAHYGTLTLRTASVRGDSARYRGQPRRDAVLTARFGAGDDALLLVATATGARAADDAHRAARDAVHWIAGAVGRSRERLAGDLRDARRASLKSGLHRLTDRCYGRLRARGEDLGLEEGEYTASLRCLLLPADPECRIRLFFGVGAGGLFRIRSGAWQDLDIAPDDTAAPFRFRATLAQPGDALLMCSAGMAEPLRGEPAFAARLAERWAEGSVPGLAGYLADVQTRVKGYADDRTAVTVWDA